MKKILFPVLLAAAACTMPRAAFAQEDAGKMKDSLITRLKTNPVHRFYVGGGMDALIFSTATMDRPGQNSKPGTLRFTSFLNMGASFNYDGRHIGGFTGIDLKNVGFIEQYGDYTIKHRSFNVGVPLGIKFGNLSGKKYGFIGGGVDFPVNFREKVFVHRGHKDKYNAWFSDRQPAVMPYVFAGICVKPGFTFKVQYYLNNYLNPDYVSNGDPAYSINMFNATTQPSGSYKPYAGYNVHLILFSIGYTINQSGAHRQAKKAMRAMNENTGSKA